MTNEEILKQMQTDIMNMVKQHDPDKFKFRNPCEGTEYELIMRCPNDKEMSVWLLQKLRSVHCSRAYNISRDTYYSMKGQCKKNHPNALKFLYKFTPDIYTKYDNYQKSECIASYTVKVTAKEPIVTETVSIDIPK